MSPTDNVKTTIGLIGMGLVGQAIARRLLAAGFQVVGFDSSIQANNIAGSCGVNVAVNITDVAKKADILVFSLPDNTVVEQVINELQAELTTGKLIVDMTTGSPSATESIANSLEQRGVEMVDATISGSSEQLLRGDVLIMAGGDDKAIQRCTRLFDAIAKDWMHAGPCGNGSRMKLVSNLVLGLNRAALAEGLAFASAMEMDSKKALEVLRRSMAYSRIMDTKGEKMIERDFEPHGRLSQHLKDVRLIQSETEIRLPLTDTHRDLLERAESLGYGELDNSAIYLTYVEGQSE